MTDSTAIDTDSDETKRSRERPTTEADADTAHYDVVIVGGGPAGCSTGVFTARSGLETCILDRGPSSIHHCAYLENYLGFPGGIDVRTFCALAEAHAREAGCAWIRDRVTAVTAVTERDGGFRLETEDGRVLTSNRVVAAAKYEADYLRPLSREVEIFESYERDGEVRERFDRSYPDDDGTTPIDGLYVAGALAGVPDQVLCSAGHGAIVGRRIRADARRQRDYWEHVADRVDWMRRDRPDNEWTDADRWREWFRSEAPEADGLECGTDRFDEIVEEVVAESLDTYLDREAVKERTHRGHRLLADHLDEEALLAALEGEPVRGR